MKTAAKATKKMISGNKNLPGTKLSPEAMPAMKGRMSTANGISPLCAAIISYDRVQAVLGAFREIKI